MSEALSRRNFIALGAVAALGARGVAPDEARTLKTIGVLGGIGPQATMEFEAHVHRASQRLIPPRLNAGYPPMVVHYCRHAPFVVDERGVPVPPRRADPRFLEAARRLGAVADFLVITSNGAHALAADVERESGRRVVSMIDATIDDVRRRQWTRAGVLGLFEPVVYTEPLARLGVACETVDSGTREALSDAIFRTMEGRNGAADAMLARSAIAALQARGVDGVILGCTEIPPMLGAAAEEPGLVDPIRLLAEAAVRAAMG